MSDITKDTHAERLPMASLVPVIREVIESGGEFNLFTRGTSMRPTICEGVHSVMLGAPTDISSGDILLYERANGQFVLHRLVRIRGDELIMCGDNQFVLEGGIHRSDVIAKVTAIIKGEESSDVKKDFFFRTRLSAIRTMRRAKRVARKIIKG